MSRLTRDGTAGPVSRDQILRHVWEQGNANFPCSADHEQDWGNVTRLIHTLLYVMTIYRALEIDIVGLTRSAPCLRCSCHSSFPLTTTKKSYSLSLTHTQTHTCFLLSISKYISCGGFSLALKSGEKKNRQAAGGDDRYSLDDF